MMGEETPTRADVAGPENPGAVVRRYIAAFNAGDADAVAALFTDKASVEDPIGSPAHVGREAIRHFYAAAIATGAQLELQGAIRVAGSHAAFPFVARLTVDGAPMELEVIDTMRFDEDGRIQEMRAYFDTVGVPDFLT